MVHERRALLPQPFVRRQAVAARQFAWSEVALLVGKDEQDVVWTRSARPTSGGLGGVAQSGSLATSASLTPTPNAIAPKPAMRRKSRREVGAFCP